MKHRSLHLGTWMWKEVEKEVERLRTKGGALRVFWIGTSEGAATRMRMPVPSRNALQGARHRCNGMVQSDML